nr:MAG TPA: hypothetical protein [Bacteriophage sp.]
MFCFTISICNSNTCHISFTKNFSYFLISLYKRIHICLCF